MRTSKYYYPKSISIFKEQLLFWAQQYEDIVWLDSNYHKGKYNSYDAILAVDAFTALKTDYFNAFDKLQDYVSITKDWLFGYLTYDLKNDTEELKSNNFDGLHFPDLYFFQPKKLFLIKDNVVEVQYLSMLADEIESDLKSISQCHLERLAFQRHVRRTGSRKVSNKNVTPIKIKLRTSKDDYFKKVEQMLIHIQRGDTYEANFCQEFFAEDTQIQPFEVFKKLNKISKSPFATYLKLEDKYLMSSSPERYIKKKGNKIISQPIKGTAKRSSNKEADIRLANALFNDEKERSENIMIVDLVRNDLARSCKAGSVVVDELFGIYSFEQVFQMISTVSGELREEVHFVDAIKNAFPMGSMTGAPKVMSMQLIEHYEKTKRGLYSGAVGYITPSGDFDFNVVIRSLLYNAANEYLSLQVGGAIVFDSDPEDEYEECLLKAKAMIDVIEKSPFED